MDAATQTTTQTARPLPKSYMPEAERVGLSPSMICVAESLAADHAGDKDAGWRWLALADVPKSAMEFLKEVQGVEFLKSKGFVIDE